MYKDLKVTSGEVAANNVKSAPDRLQGTATENKNVFDKLVELFVAKYNDLLDELDDNEIKAIDPITISGYTISHANSGVTQGMYGTDQEQDPQHGEKFIVPYIIVDEHGHIVSAGNSEVQLPSGGGGGTSDYDDLTDKPSINSVTLSGNKTSSDLSLASATHTHTKSEITDFPALATVATTGDYDDLSDKPSIPTKTSDLANDSLFLRGDTAGVYRGTSTTSGSTGTKSVTCSNFTSSQLQIGVLVMVDFTHDNSASVDDLKLNVNATGAKPIRMMKNGNAEKLPAASFIKVIRTYPFYYDGDYWIMVVDSTPTKVSDLTNDSGFITGYTETDPVFTASAAHGITSSDISDWNNKSDFSGDYDDLTNKPSIPSKTSDLNNDSGFLTSETDPVFSASASSGISSSDITSWNGKSTVSFTRYTTSGTNIADIDIDGTTTKIYAPTSGGGGVTDYDQLTSRPQINSTTLTGNKSSSDLGVADEVHTHTKSDITDFPTITDEKVKNTKITPSSTPTTYYVSGSQSSSTATEELVKSDIATISVVNQNNHTAVALGLGVNSNDTQGSITLSGYNGKDTVVQPNASVSSYSTTITLPDTTGTVALTSDIPTKVSDLTNDSGYITGYTETDPVFSASAASGITSSDISSWNGKSDFSGDYDDLTNKPSIPSNTSDLNNDSHFIAKGDFEISSHTTSNQTISGGSTMSAATQTFTKTGYYPLAISGWVLNGSNATNLTLVHLYISSQASGSVGVTYRIHNAGSSQSTSTNVRVYILWIKEN